MNPEPTGCEVGLWEETEMHKSCGEKLCVDGYSGKGRSAHNGGDGFPKLGTSVLAQPEIHVINSPTPI